MTSLTMIKDYFKKQNQLNPFLSFVFIFHCLSYQVSAQSGLKKVESFLKHADEIREIWPGFLDQFHHAIYDNSGKVYLALEGQKPKGWELEKTVNDVPVFFKKDKNFLQYSDLFILNHAIADGVSIDAAFNKEQANSILFHESFHRYQKTLSMPATEWNDIEVTDYQIAIKQKEFGLLYQLLKLDNKDMDQFKKSISLYTSIRKYRESKMSNKAVALEKSMEWHEGVAQFIGDSVKIIIENNNHTISSMLNDYGLKFNENINNYSSIDQFMRWQAYYHGAAVCYLLSHFSSTWQSDIEQGKMPFDLLEKAVGSVTYSDQEIENMLDIAMSHKSQINKRKTFTELKNWKNTLIFNLKKQTPTFKTQSLESFENGILVKKVDQVNFENEMFSIYGRPISLFMETQKSDFANNAYLKIKKMPKLSKNCHQLSETQWLCKAGTKIKIASLKIKIKQDLTINVDDGVMSI